MNKWFIFILGLCPVATIMNMDSENRGYHWDPKLAQQLYVENGCQVCGNFGHHSLCNKIGVAAKKDMELFLAKMSNAICTYGYPHLMDGFGKDILERELRSSLHPYTIKTLYDRFGADQVAAQLKRTCKQALLYYLKKRKKFMDDQIIPGNIDYHTIYVALARKIHILYIAIEILEGRLPYTIWSLKEETD